MTVDPNEAVRMQFSLQLIVFLCHFNGSLPICSDCLSVVLPITGMISALANYYYYFYHYYLYYYYYYLYY